MRYSNLELPIFSGRGPPNSPLSGEEVTELGNGGKGRKGVGVKIMKGKGAGEEGNERVGRLSPSKNLPLHHWHTWIQLERAMWPFAKLL